MKQKETVQKIVELNEFYKATETALEALNSIDNLFWGNASTPENIEAIEAAKRVLWQMNIAAFKEVAEIYRPNLTANKKAVKVRAELQEVF